MKVSYNWIQEYLDFPLPPVNELVEKIGAQLGAVEEVIDLGARYKGAVIVNIVTCEKLENSDHLNRCMVDDNGTVQGVTRDEQGLVQVITGAPNVHADMMVVWLPPGTTVPSSFDDDPFVLEARELRGALSNGMLASAKELAIGDNHEGILELVAVHEPDDAKRANSPVEAIAHTLTEPTIKPGDTFADAYKLNDYIIDIENKMFTHRPDCFGQLGVAREVAGIIGKPFVSPAVYLAAKAPLEAAAGAQLKVRNEVPELVPRFVAQVFENVEIRPSSLLMQTYLSRVGIRPINTVVDVTNYMMVLTGQPSHAYDYDKVVAQDPGATAPTLVIRHPKPEETLELLNGKTITPRPEAIMIATETKAIGLGGIMGGASTEVDDSTQRIILEIATFDMYNVRRSSMAHGIFSDAVSRFNKGQSPLQNDRILAWARGNMICESGAMPTEVVDVVNLPPDVLKRDSLFTPITLSARFVNERLGLMLSPEAIATLLTNVEFRVTIDNESLIVTAPFWRTDIELREDIVEEVGRLYGFDELPLALPLKNITPVVKDRLLTLKQRLRASLVKAGANELLNYSFVHSRLFDRVGQDAAHAFKLANALSPDLEYYRISILPSLLDKVFPNHKAGYHEFALFEIGKSHTLLQQNAGEDGLPQACNVLALVYSADRTNKTGAAFYEARAFLDYVAHECGLALSYRPITDMPTAPIAKPYDLARSAYVFVKGSETFLGMVGEFTPSVLRNLKLPDRSAGFEVSLDDLLKVLPDQASYTPLSRYPSVSQDICLKVDTNLNYEELRTFVWDTLTSSKPDETVVALSPVDIYQAAEDQDHKQTTFRVTISSYQKTLTDKEVSALLDGVAAAASERYQAVRI